MYNLSLREDWKTSKKFCKSIIGKISMQIYRIYLMCFKFVGSDDDLDCKQSVKRNGIGEYNGKAMNGKA